MARATTYPSPRCYLMFNRRNGYTKIGSSGAPSTRERTLQAEDPDTVLVAISKPGMDGRKLERQYHENYRWERIRGEWFKLEPGDFRGFICFNFDIVPGQEEQYVALCDGVSLDDYLISLEEGSTSVGIA